MSYDWTQLGINEITNLYLYGTPTTPTDLTNEALIRPKDSEIKGGPRYGADIVVDMASFMETGPGRFALGSLSKLVQTFFDPATDLSWMELGGNYSKEEMVLRLSLEKIDGGVSITQSKLDDGAGDFIQRAYVWNSGAFKLSDEVTFSIDEKGNRKINNYAIVTNEAVQENFDFVGGGIIAGVSNSMNAGLIDPSGIGRKVEIKFTDDGLPKKTYGLSDFISDGQKHALHQGKGLLALATLPQEEVSLIENLWGSGATRTLIDGKAIIFGSDKADNLDISKLQQSYAVTGPLSPFFDGNYLRSYYEQHPEKGLAFVAGEGNDVITGFTYNDHLYGGAGNDALEGRGGADYLEGGADYDTYKAGAGDTILDTDRSGRVLFDKVLLTGGHLQDDGSYLSSDGKFSYRLVDQVLTVTETGTGGALTIDNFRQSGDLGIVLGEPVAAFVPPPTTAGNILQGDL
ncbi:MAG: calcium-binding protein, partial [Halothiobacillus sp.]